MAPLKQINIKHRKDGVYGHWNASKIGNSYVSQVLCKSSPAYVSRDLLMALKRTRLENWANKMETIT
jgi:hypothetical protein